MASRDDKKAASKPSSSRTGGVRTIADLNRPPGDDSYGPPEYYTGGQKSGMLVHDPSQGNDVDSIFQQARQLGAVERPVGQHNPPSSSRSFTGTGRLLSGETVPSIPQQTQPDSIIHNIIFWSNGFTVNDGPLRTLDDPENASFLESIKKSECPEELEPPDRRSSVNVNLIRRNENCPDPEKRQAPFQGVGRTLGSVAPSAASEQGLGETSVSCNAAPSTGLTLDESLPSTSIQLRLADGTRMIAHLNYHHTIGHIRSLLDASWPRGARSYQLQTMGFPPKQLTDPNETIEQAGLANSVVIQKF